MRLFSPLRSSVRTIRYHNLGRLGYGPALDVQKRLVDAHGAAKDDSDAASPDVVLLVEHEPVYTIGLRDASYSDADRRRLERLGADFYRVDRGGLITYHGPGQLVVYPILDLRRSPFSPSVRWYVCRLESVVIDLCREFYGVTAKRTEHTGIWVGNDKIAAIGVKNKNGVVSHGLALNCETDLKWYDHVVPCGIADPSKWVTSLTKVTGSRVSVEDVVEPFLKCFSNVFQCEMKEVTRLDEVLTNSDGFS